MTTSQRELVTNENSLDISQFVTRVLSEFTEPNKDEERVIFQL